MLATHRYPALADHLGALIYFEDAAAETLARIVDRALYRTFSAGEAIFWEGDPAAGLWVIETGRVKIYKLNPQGDQQILHLLGESNTFNDIATFDGGPNPANAEALTNTRLWLIPAAVLNEAMRLDNALALRVVRALAARVRSLVGQIEDLTLYSVTIRLARFLVKQLEDPSLAGPGVTRTAIAGHINTTPQTISTALRELEATGAITFDRHRICIVREDLLRAIAML
jgi:CRP-like cAMP-binding protein